MAWPGGGTVYDSSPPPVCQMPEVMDRFGQDVFFVSAR